jgi:hypothetical protein
VVRKVWKTLKNLLSAAARKRSSVPLRKKRRLRKSEGGK